ncbi:WD40 repeat-like protein [Wallemia mellicola]|uniref:methylated diphthine methylhydrolase n=1 Tax=Wallemia mellicola TaxID=1708541 RepID=A0A4V4MME0_9BASI|nr:WD40 repeat-like protein [Wallemia mellicola]
MQVFDQISFNNTACSVEYNSLLDLYAVGTYELVETKTNEQGLISHQERQGECILYDCKERKFNVIDSKSTPGTLDIKWMKDFIAVVDAKGYLSVDKYENKKLKQLSLVDCKSDNQSLALSLDWSNSRKEVEPIVAVSMSDGRALTVNSATEQVLVDWQAHDYETWIAAWDHYKPNDIIYTGADDCVLKCWDLRSGVDTPIASNKRFEGGVTTIANSPHDQNIIAVGSYDENLRIFDKRNINKPINSIKTSGGIWRIKFSEVENMRMVMANMYGGFDVVNYQTNVIEYTNSDHNLAYGVDWNRDGLIMSASFYDKKGMLWVV